MQPLVEKGVVEMLGTSQGKSLCNRGAGGDGGEEPMLEYLPLGIDGLI
ncbi:hypothetical protein [Nostoc sp.]